MKPIKVIISGGGTGGHIFPAIAIARAIQAERPDAEILFVGAEGKMEMERVPLAGYKIVGLPIVGIQRRLTFKNLLVPFKILKSLRLSRTIIREFRPDIAIGVGGYASGPLLRAASSMKMPTVIQEQNSYPGVTNKILSKKANKICVAYQGMDQWFPKEKIILTGNPVRSEVVDLTGKRERALVHFNLVPGRRTVLVVGGSLGARTINESVHSSAQQWIDAGLQIIWQTGKGYEETAQQFAIDIPQLNVQAFIREMDLAYAAADIIISRAGAMSISELCLVGKPCIFIPSPNVSEDHQTKNAMALVDQHAALLVRDVDARKDLCRVLLDLVVSPEEMKLISQNILPLGIPGAAQKIAREVLDLI